MGETQKRYGDNGGRGKKKDKNIPYLTRPSALGPAKPGGPGLGNGKDQKYEPTGEENLKPGTTLGNRNQGEGTNDVQLQRVPTMNNLKQTRNEWEGKRLEGGGEKRSILKRGWCMPGQRREEDRTGEGFLKPPVFGNVWVPKWVHTKC